MIKRYLVLTLITAVQVLFLNSVKAEECGFYFEDTNNLRIRYPVAVPTVSAEAVSSAAGLINMEVQINAATIRATFDKQSRTLTIDGFGSSLLPHQKAILIKLVNCLQKIWQVGEPDFGRRDLKKHFLYRFLNLLSESPAGMPIGEMRVKVPLQ